MDRPLELPCGQCDGCRMERSKQWAMRCVHEAQLHKRNCFVTLTYAPEALPRDGSVNIEHWQKFAKRLRRAIEPERFRFFMCGEYGEKTLRPHYHAILFGLDFSEDRFVRSKNFRGDRLYESPFLTERWGLGMATIGEVNFASAAYCARYVMKKVTGPEAEKHYTRTNPDTGERFKVRPEFVSMSRRPGLGAGWFAKFGASDVVPRDEVVIDGRRFRPPRFYDEKLEPEVLESVKRKRRDAVAKRSEDLTPERLSVREKVFASRIDRLVRKL